MAKNTEQKISNWYYFSIILIIIEILCGIICYANNLLDISIIIGCIIATLCICSIIILLSKIEYNTRINNNQSNTKINENNKKINDNPLYNECNDKDNNDNFLIIDLITLGGIAITIAIVLIKFFGSR